MFSRTIKPPLIGLVGLFLGMGMVLAKTKENLNNDSPSALTGETNSVKAPTQPQSTEVSATNAVPAHFNETSDRVVTLKVGELKDFDSLSLPIQALLTRALALTQLGLTYKYGSCDPANGGMDCSGTVYYLLQQAGLKDVPRDSSEMYRWVWKAGLFNAVVSSHIDSFEFANLKPGDLLFWTGTYQIDRDPPVTHVMIYLGINRDTGKRVMVGASEGRRYAGIARAGVSVFDLELPRVSKTDANPHLESRFIGYGSIPGLQSGSRADGDSFLEKKKL